MAVYKLLTDGLAPNSGVTITMAAERLGISKQAVSKQAIILEKDGAIVRILGAKRNILYTRGPRSNIYDTLAENWSTPCNGEGVMVNPDRLTKTSPSEAGVKPVMMEVSTSRAHCDGGFIFPVIEIGDIIPLNIPAPDGRVLKQPIFEKEPYNKKNGVNMWRGHIPYGGRKVTVQFIEGTEKQSLAVYPPECELVPSQFKMAEAIFRSKAIEIVSILEKHGGWQLGPPEFRGEIHYPSTDERILARMPEDARGSKASSLWIDRSLGEREIETNDPRVAMTIFDTPRAMREFDVKYEEMKKRVEEQESRIAHLEWGLRELASISENTTIVNDRIIGVLEMVYPLRSEQEHRVDSKKTMEDSKCDTSLGAYR